MQSEPLLPPTCTGAGASLHVQGLTQQAKFAAKSERSLPVQAPALGVPFIQPPEATLPPSGFLQPVEAPGGGLAFAQGVVAPIQDAMPGYKLSFAEETCR